jgi:hypothetical protein
MWSKYIFFNPVACCFLYKAKYLLAPLVAIVRNRYQATISEDTAGAVVICELWRLPVAL